MAGKSSGNNDVLQFFIGLAMLVVGGYMFLNNVEVMSGNIFRFVLFGRQMDGVLFIPLIASIIFLFYRYNIWSKICCCLSMLIILVNVIMNLRLYWRSSSLFALIVIFVLLFGGLGLVMKTVFANPDGDHGKKY